MDTPSKKILVSGSLAYDRIMVFPGKFSEHILPDKIHTLNVSFGIDEVTEHFGGTAGNISYNLTLLGERPTILSSAGNDFSRYYDWLKRHAIDLSFISEYNDLPTASAYIITDRADNQITAFHMGAMRRPLKDLPSGVYHGVEMAIVSPGNKEDMREFSKIYQERGIPYIFDPGQALPFFEIPELQKCISGAWILMVNDYEMSYIEKKAEMKKEDILKNSKALVVTLGEKGSKIFTQDAEHSVPAARPQEVSDPTGAGDGYRAGLIKGILSGLPWEVSGRLGSVVSVYTVEKYGTQTHTFTLEDIRKRYKENFGEEIKFES